MTEDTKTKEKIINYEEELLKYSKKKGELTIYLGSKAFFFSLEHDDTMLKPVAVLAEKQPGPVVLKVKELSDKHKEALYKAIVSGQVILTSPKEKAKVEFGSIDTEIERGIPILKQRVYQLIDRNQFEDLKKAAKDYFSRKKSERDFQVDVVLIGALNRGATLDTCPSNLLFERQKEIEALNQMRLKNDK